MTPNPPDSFERQLQDLAYRNGGPVSASPVRELLETHTLIPCGSGVFHDVFRIAGTAWVVKESRWHLEIPIPFRPRIPGWLIHGPLRMFGTGCLPTEREIRRQHELYCIAARYLGYFDVPDAYPDGPQLIAEQRIVRNRLPTTVAAMETFYERRIPDAVRSLLESPMRLRNVLPKEYLLFGTPRTGGRMTSYVFQEYAEGRLLHDARDALQPDMRRQLVLLAYLLLLLRQETGLVPDTRPRQPFHPSSDWLLDTDNIVVGASGMTLVDTRWFWEADGNIVQRGLGLAERTIRACWRVVETGD